MFCRKTIDGFFILLIQFVELQEAEEETEKKKASEKLPEPNKSIIRTFLLLFFIFAHLIHEIKRFLFAAKIVMMNEWRRNGVHI